MATVFPYAVDSALRIDSNYRFTNADRAYLDSQIRAIQAYLLNGIGTAVTTTGGVYTATSDSATMSLPSAGTPVKATFAHTLPTIQNASIVSNGVRVAVAGIVDIFATVSFIVNNDPNTEVLFQLYQNSTPLPDAIQVQKIAAGAYPTYTGSIALVSTQLASANDTFYLYAYTSAASGTTSLSIVNAHLSVRAASARQGFNGIAGPAGAPGSNGFVVQSTFAGNNPGVPRSVAILNTWDLPIDTFTGPVAPTMPNASLGSIARIGDVGGATDRYNITLTDPNGYLIQNPVDRQYYSIITWGAGTGGMGEPNLPAHSAYSWQLISLTRSGVTTYRWRWVGS